MAQLPKVSLDAIDWWALLQQQFCSSSQQHSWPVSQEYKIPPLSAFIPAFLKVVPPCPPSISLTPTHSGYSVRQRSGALCLLQAFLNGSITFLPRNQCKGPNSTWDPKSTAGPSVTKSGHRSPALLGRLL